MLLTFSKTYLSSIGVVWLFVEMYNGLMPESINCSFWCLIIVALILAIIWFLINGYYIDGFLKQTIVLRSNAFDTKIVIIFDDLFRQDGWKAIPVNEFFDSIVDDRHVSPKSLHGMLINKYWSSETEDWDQQVKNSLSNSNLAEYVPRSSGKTEKYSIGSTAVVQKKGNNFFCVALTKTNISTLQALATPSELYQSLIGLLIKARECCSGSPLNIPLFGSGLARTNIKPSIVVNLILLAIFEESKKEKITDDIRIIIPKSKKKDIDLSTIYKNWR
ncbi:macro domain-containing protein [Methanolobus psychrotolerans]|uniref:macro domain-containing protein n=1 Tax=Methanolobus psychrotolerans TaxID=1874706 RepID=UPI000B916321|nr:macro domain-containing protein [Methanolobus psychrotolerans]